MTARLAELSVLVVISMLGIGAACRRPQKTEVLPGAVAFDASLAGPLHAREPRYSAVTFRCERHRMATLGLRKSRKRGHLVAA